MKHLAWLFVILLAGCNVASPTNPNGPTGGVSQINFLTKQQDGVVFRETFENTNFISADGWTTVQGVPTNSTAQAKQGIASFQCTGTSSTLSVIQKPLIYSQSNIPFAANYTMAECWFYDDLTRTSGIGPYFKVQTNDNKFFQIGVRNSVSTSYYVCNPSNSTAADTFLTTSSELSFNPVTRTTGWHKFQVLMGYNGGTNYTLCVDGNQIINQTAQFTQGQAYFSNVFVCSGTSADTGGTFGYFDTVAVYKNQSAKINNAGSRTINWYDSNNNLVMQNDTLFPFTNNTGANLVGDIYSYPLKLRLEISTSANGHQLEYSSPYMYFFPGDIYAYNGINFGRKVTTYDTNVKELQSVNISTAGVRETNNYAIKNDLTFSVNKLEGYQWRQSIDNFFTTAVQGMPFSLMVDNISDNALGIISTSTQPAATSVTIGASIATTPTSNFTMNNYYVVRNTANTNRQVVQVTGISTSTLTFDQPLNFATNPGDYVYSLLYYPFLEVNGNSPTGFKVTDPSIPRYNWTQSCSEYNNG